MSHFATVSKVIRENVDEEDKRVIQRSDFTTLENNLPKEVFPVNFVDANIPNRGLTVINESGVYALVFGSKLPNTENTLIKAEFSAVKVANLSILMS